MTPPSTQKQRKQSYSASCRPKTLRTPVPPLEPTSRPPSIAGARLGTRVSGRALVLPAQHKPHLPREIADDSTPYPGPAEGAAPDLAFRQPIRKEADGAIGLLAQPPLRIHTESEGKSTPRSLHCYGSVDSKLDRVSVVDDLFERLVPVGGTADAGDEDADGKLIPFYTLGDITKPHAVGHLALGLDKNIGNQAPVSAATAV
eukprot:CAMPEP_0185770736 /NCGR_PEP_ID=MMETSP1174-20130828/60850_1 /TAXON_ID=35687 /ORGANISM="Dictyocha speculum, Strain CCMP1381" /LENGTH=201 /DNA_ID=CAMNT_0028456299 /DNA_START=259 /DNA_END=866 /DNA_ORIENTATION=-